MPNKKSTNVELIQRQEEESFAEEGPEAVPPKDVFSYNELRSCEDLVRLVKEGTLAIKPHFQRNFVWNESQQSEFIDSLVKQLPIPSMCFSIDSSNDERMVIDGLQRMSTIKRFLTEKDWRLKKSTSIARELSGKTVADIERQHLSLYRKIQNTTIPVTIVRCDSSKTDHLEYLFMIFRRLNSGGVKLTNQEIRNCIFSGEMNSLLGKLVKNATWRKLFSIKERKIDRMKDEELVLRFFAFIDLWKKYDDPLVQFLNTYMESNRKISSTEVLKKEKLFGDLMEFLEKKSIIDIFDKDRNTITEAALVGIALNLNNLKNASKIQVEAAYTKFRNSQSVSDDTLKQGIMEKNKVVSRMKDSIKAFSF